MHLVLVALGLRFGCEIFLRLPAQLVAFLGVALGARRKRFGRGRGRGRGRGHDTFAPSVFSPRDDDVRWVRTREAVLVRRGLDLETHISARTRFGAGRAGFVARLAVGSARAGALVARATPGAVRILFVIPEIAGVVIAAIVVVICPGPVVGDVVADAAVQDFREAVGRNEEARGRGGELVRSLVSLDGRCVTQLAELRERAAKVSVAVNFGIAEGTQRRKVHFERGS